MALARCNLVITDEDGNIVDGSTVTVTDESTGAMAVPYSDRDGTVGLGNPYIATDGANAGFYAIGGAYRIDAVLGGFSRTWRHQGVGTAQEADIDALGTQPPTGLLMTFDNPTADADPTQGKWRADSATFASITKLWFDNLDRNGASITSWLDHLDDVGVASNRGVLRAELRLGATTQWAEFQVTGSVTDKTGYREVSVTPLSQVAWPFADEAMVHWTFAPAGPQGVAGVSSPAVNFIFSTTTTDADPGAGKLRYNNATVASVTTIYADNLENGGGTITGWLDAFDDAAGTVKGYLYISKVTDPTKFAMFRVGGTVVDGTGYRKISVTHLASNGTFSDLDAIQMMFVPSGENSGGIFMGYGDIINGTLVESRAGNAVTFALKTLAGSDPSSSDPVQLCFRNATVGTGNYVYRTVTAALSLTISSGSTMGFSSGVAGRLWLVLFDDAGTIRLGAINCLSGTNIYPLGQMPIASSTAEGGAGAADSAHVFYTGTAVTAKPYLVLGYASYESGLATAGTWNAAPTRLQLHGRGGKLPGDEIQRATNQSGAVNTGTTTIPSDDTIPQNTEGVEFLTQAITPASAANVLRIAARVHLANNNNQNFTAALFQDSTANALAAAHLLGPGSNQGVSLSIEHEMLSGINTSTTFKVRAGANASGTTTFNGESAARLYGGVYNSFLRATEVMA